jgi:hypothetical protein
MQQGVSVVCIQALSCCTLRQFTSRMQRCREEAEILCPEHAHILHQGHAMPGVFAFPAMHDADGKKLETTQMSSYAESVERAKVHSLC